jgi:hypothetical protein
MTKAIRSLTMLLVSAALVVLGGPTSPALADRGQRTIDVPMTLTDGFDLPDSLPAGWTTFEVSTPDVAPFFLHYLQAFQLKNGATTDQVIADFRQALTAGPPTAADAVRSLERNADLVGGAAIDAGTKVSVTLPLTKGTYYFLDLNDFFVPGQQVVLHRLRVTGTFQGHAPKADAALAMADVHGQPRFLAPKRLPADGTFLVTNLSDDIHELALFRTVPSATDRDVQRFFESGGPNPFAEESLRGMGSLSPGRFAYLHVDGLPAAPYALLDFVPDDKDGTPNVVHGMAKVVSLTP